MYHCYCQQLRLHTHLLRCCASPALPTQLLISRRYTLKILVTPTNSSITSISSQAFRPAISYLQLDLSIPVTFLVALLFGTRDTSIDQRMMCAAAPGMCRLLFARKRWLRHVSNPSVNETSKHTSRSQHRHAATFLKSQATGMRRGRLLVTRLSPKSSLVPEKSPAFVQPLSA